MMVDLEPTRLLRIVTPGLLAGITTIITEISLGTLIFSGVSSQFVASGIGFALTGACVISVVTALLSSYPGTISVPQEVPTVILAQVAAGISSGLAGSASSETAFVTVVAVLVLTTLLTGGFFLGLGWLQAGRLVRYVPYPVIGGFLAGTGWLLVAGAINIMTEMSFSIGHLPEFLVPTTLLKWVPGLLLGGGILYALNRWGHFSILPGALLGSVPLFFGLVLPMGYSISELQEIGLLLDTVPGTITWNPVLFASLPQVKWGIIAQQSGQIVAVMIVSVIALLLNAGGIELETERELDFDSELKTAGLANLLAGWTGGPVGYASVSPTALGSRMGVNSRVTGILVGLCCGAFVLGGSPVLTLFPTFVVGGILVFLGLSFLYEWLYSTWFELPRTEYAIVFLILVVIANFGFLEGVGVGLIVSVVMFTFKYGTINVIKQALDGRTIQSNVNRPDKRQEYLRQNGEAISVLRLQGFIFFGTSYVLVERLRDRVDDPSKEALEFVVLDFDQVPGFDSSARISFVKMIRLAQSESFQLVLANLAPELEDRLRGVLEGERGTGGQHYKFLSDLDHALEFCEERLLADADPEAISERPLAAYFEDRLSDESEVSVVLSHFEARDVVEGDVLIEQGAEPGGLYFIESGAAEVRLETGETSARLQGIRPGAFFGEIGLYLGTERSASVVVTAPGTVHRLSERALLEMERDHPEVAIAFHRLIVEMLSERVIYTNETLEHFLQS